MSLNAPDSSVNDHTMKTRLDATVETQLNVRCGGRRLYEVTFKEKWPVDSTRSAAASLCDADLSLSHSLTHSCPCAPVQHAVVILKSFLSPRRRRSQTRQWERDLPFSPPAIIVTQRAELQKHFLIHGHLSRAALYSVHISTAHTSSNFKNKQL